MKFIFSRVTRREFELQGTPQKGNVPPPGVLKFLNTNVEVLEFDYRL